MQRPMHGRADPPRTRSRGAADACIRSAGKPRRSPAQLHELVLARMEAVMAAEVAAGGTVCIGRPSIGMPHPHPTDALGRNWDIAEARGLRRIAPVRVVIDSVREAFDIDPA